MLNRALAETELLLAGGDKIIEFGLKHELLVTNTFSKKRQPIISPTRMEVMKRRLITSCNRKGFKKEVTDCKVIAGEAVVCRLKMEVKNRSGQEIREKKLNWWKLERYKKEFLDEVKSRCTEGVLPDSWEEAADVIGEQQKRPLGGHQGRRRRTRRHGGGLRKFRKR